MIFVTIGMMYGFDRLIRKMDEIAGMIEEEVIMQIGVGTYKPENGKYFEFLSKKDMDNFYNSARIIVCHSGVGSIISALDYNKPIVVVPRLHSYGEVIDDHQIEIAKKLEDKGKIHVVNNLDKLENVINNINGEYNNFNKKNELMNNGEYNNFYKKNELIDNLREYLDTLNIKK